MTDRPTLPQLSGLHERHYGLTPEVAGCYAQAASVCLSRHHTPPTAVMVSAEGLEARDEARYSIQWEPPAKRVCDSWANTEDATRDGAYALALAAAEAHLGMVAIRRAAEKSGADYYIGAVGSDINDEDGLLDLESAIRLEVSGIDRALLDSEWKLRLRQKEEQARRGKSIDPAIAVVAVFNLCRIAFRKAC